MITIQSLYTQQLDLKQHSSQQSINTKTVESYTVSLRAALSILFTFNDFAAFVEAMQSAIERNLTMAWEAGAASCGISSSDISDAEVAELFGLILRDFSFVGGLGADVVAGRARGLSIESFYPRLNIWANRWEETRAIAQSLSCGDQKLMWQLGVADHCESCLQLSGKVKRASTWAIEGIFPKMPTLACGGFNCKCTFVATDLPLTSGSIAPSLSVNVGRGLAGGLLLGGAVIAAIEIRRQIIKLASGTNVGDESINLETGHGLTFGQTITISENGRSYTGTVFASGPSVVEVAPPLNFSFSVDASVTRG